MKKSIKEAEAKAIKKLRGYDGLKRQMTGNGYDGMQVVNRYDGNMGIHFTQEPIATNYDVNLVNANAATRIALISGGMAGTSEAGLISTAGAFNDKNGNAGLTGSTTAPQTYATLTSFASRNPIQLLGLNIRSTVDGQQAQKITVRRQSPTRDLENFTIPLAPDASAKDNTQKVSSVDLRPWKLSLDDQTIIELPISGTSTADITLWFGRIGNIAGAFNSSL